MLIIILPALNIFDLAMMGRIDQFENISYSQCAYT